VSAQRRRCALCSAARTRQAPRYARQISVFERVLFEVAADGVRQARGDVLELAIGTGPQSTPYSADTTLTGSS
jgi:hypothetical protein